MLSTNWISTGHEVTRYTGKKIENIKKLFYSENELEPSISVIEQNCRTFYFMSILDCIFFCLLSLLDIMQSKPLSRAVVPNRSAAGRC